MKRRISHVAVAATALVLVIGTAACSSSGSSAKTSNASSSGASADTKLTSLLPSSIKSSAKLTVAMEMDYPPDQFYGPDGKTPTGYNADLSEGLAGVLGLHADLINVNFSGILAGLDAGRYDLGASGFYDTPEREKNALFVDYMQTGNTILVKSGNSVNIKSTNDFCGHKIAQDAGEAQVVQEQAISKKYCAAHGKPAVTIEQYKGAGDAYQAILSGRADATLETFDTNAYQVKQHPGAFQVTGPLYKGPLWGIGIAKDQTKLAQAVAGAINVMIANGSYAKILKKWGITAAALPHAEINQVPYTGGA